MKSKSVKIIFIGLFIVLAGGVGVFNMLKMWVDSDVDFVSNEALKAFPDADEVDALLVYLQSEEINLEEKNKVVWAL